MYFADLPNKVQSAAQDSLRGHVLSNGIDANGRLIGFVHPGDHPGPDGAAVFVDDALVDGSVNAALLSGGLAYPAFYATLPASLRTHLAAKSMAARATRPPTGLWARSSAEPDGPATVADQSDLERQVLWPKLFRRIVPYLAAGFSDFDGFDGWLRADPIHRDDRLFLLTAGEHGNLHDVIGTDRGKETVTLVNTTPAAVDLAGWWLAGATRPGPTIPATPGPGACRRPSRRRCRSSRRR